jgi:hypothetical protein
LIKIAKLELYKLKNVVFGGNILELEKNSFKIDESILGVMINSRIDSIILPKINHFGYLLSWCEFPVDQKWNLIHRASQDGFEGSSFHAKCDYKPNTLIIIKSKNGTVKLSKVKRLPNRTELITSSSRRTALELFYHFCVFFLKSSVRSKRTSKLTEYDAFKS